MLKQTPGLSDTFLGTNELLTGGWKCLWSHTSCGSQTWDLLFSLLKPPSYFYLYSWSFRKRQWLLGEVGKSVDHYVSPCLHGLLFCFSLVHDAKVCQNCWLSPLVKSRGLFGEWSFWVVSSVCRNLSVFPAPVHELALARNPNYAFTSVLLFSVQTTSVQGDFL